MAQEDDDRIGTIRITSPGTLVVLGLIGLVAGWAGRHYAPGSWPTPDVSWLVAGAFWFVAAITGGIAYLTRRTVLAARPVLTAQQGTSRLVLGKTICRVASIAFGLSVGVTISQLGIASESAGSVIVRSLIGALGAALGIAAGLLLEHACRVPPGAEGDLP